VAKTEEISGITPAESAGARLRVDLLDEMWGYENYPCTRTVDNHVRKLRHKLELDAEHPQYFRTVYRVGYKFVP